MRRRQARKLIKKYGMNWIYTTIYPTGRQKTYIKIPDRWNNKIMRKLMDDTFGMAVRSTRRWELNNKH